MREPAGNGASRRTKRPGVRRPGVRNGSSLQCIVSCTVSISLCKGHIQTGAAGLGHFAFSHSVRDQLYAT
jgi:hypothetical protein